VRELLRRQGQAAARLRADELVERGVDARLSGVAALAGHAARLRPRPARAVRPHPLGGHRDLDLLERLHGRRRAGGRAGRRRSAGGALMRKRILQSAICLLLLFPAAASARDKWDVQVLAHVPPPGYPALSLVAPDRIIY